MTRTIRITDEEYQIVKTIAAREERNLSTILAHAIKNYARLKKIDHEKRKPA